MLMRPTSLPVAGPSLLAWTAPAAAIDFENNSGGDDARIEVRVEDGQVRVRVD